MSDHTVGKRPAARAKPLPSGILGYGVLLATLGAYVGFYASRLHHLPTMFDYTSIVNTALPLVFAALGQSLVVLTGGIDLSVGGVVSLCVALAATRLHGSPADIVLWLVLVCLVGTAAGALNGLIVAKGRIAPILATLATLSIYSGLALRVLPSPGGSIPHGLTTVVSDPNVPLGLIWLAVAAAGWLVLRRTRFGMRIFAIGSDEASARAVGIPTARVKVAVYALAGLCASFAAICYVSTTTTGDPTAGAPFILTSIAAVVVGGIAFNGGRGSALGAIAGAVALTLVIDVLFFAGINPLYQSLFQGLFLVVAVLLGGLVALAGRRKAAR